MRRLDDLGARLGEALWHVVGGEEADPEELTMANVRRFMYEQVERNQNVVGCVLNVQRKGEGYEVVQLMINSEELAIQSGRGYLGRTMRVQRLGDDLVEFMDGEIQKMIKA